ncbi:MAG: hypothetical protein H8E32_04025 [Nitrospinae bacterium]|nr:hypothetical protein [Nitrospinota bacterium]
MQKFKSPTITEIRFLLTLLFLFTSACGTLDPFKQSQKELDIKIKAFNFEFESKALERSARFVHPDHLKEFQKNSLNIRKRVSILEASTLDLKFLKGDKPAPSTSSIFEADFDKVELTVRYQLSILPSTKVKTIFVTQEWVMLNDSWYVIPDLDPFLN